MASVGKRQAAEKDPLRLAHLTKISREITTTTDLKELYRKVVTTSRDLLALDFSSLMLLSPDASQLIMTDAIGFPDTMIGTFNLLEGEGLASLVARRGKPATVRDFRRETRFGVPQAVTERHILSAVSVPMMLEGKVFGILVGHTVDKRSFSREEIALYQVIGNQAAVAIQNSLHISALKESEAKFRTLFNSAGDAVYIIDFEGEFIEVNQSACEELGFSREEFLSMEPSDVISCQQALGCHERLQIVREAGQLVFEALHVRRDGTAYPVEMSSRLVEFAGKPAVLAVARDITERKRAQDEIQQLAYYDALTGLPNRLLFCDRLSQAQAQASRDGRQAVVLFLDLDRFKEVNDTLGHSAGDELLKAVAGRLLACVRRTDTVSRLGGDEFVLILSSVHRDEDIAAIAQKIQDELAEPLLLGGQEIFCTCSIGIAVYPVDGEDVDTLLKNADIAMYQAKEQGRNTYQFFSREMNVKAVERLVLETGMRHALEREEFFLFYQPQVNLATGRIFGMEALLRWRHPDLGFLSPAKFIPLAEESGLIMQIGERVLRAACARNKAWQDAGFPPLQVAVNLSGYQFRHGNLVEMVESVLGETGLDPRWLELELTESAIMESPERAAMTLHRLKERGISLAIDDFGTGYSSLSHLKQFPIGRLKIAQFFVRDVTTNPDDAAIAEAIIAMAHSLKLKVIAEGVEQRDQMDFLRAHRCDEMQGFFFSRPLSEEAFTAVLADGLSCGEVRFTAGESARQSPYLAIL
ncbi:MAG TPA: EAL domain-containing protein [Geobacteraceae bacterium]